ncbi:MAG: phosphate ABC transporter substrate-binding protein PstS [Comamonadaceae bacterium]
MQKFLAITLFALVSLTSQAAGITNFTGAGSSAAAPIYRSWAAEYQKQSGAVLSYDPVGSSAGLKKIRAGETGFGASDVAPSQAELDKDGLVLFPVAITGIAPVFNLPAIRTGQLRLNGDLLARIFMGEIKRWNATPIAQLNPELTLPATPIKVLVRSDGSGTTYNFSDYLAKVNPAWKEKMGVKTTIVWPTGFIGVKGSDGVVKGMKNTVGAIGYVDFGYVKDNDLRAVKMKNAEEEFLYPSISGFKSALSNSDWVKKSNFTTTLTNHRGRETWPITMGTFALVPRITDNVARTQPALQFFVWAFMNGDALVQKNNFVRLPDRVQALAFKAIASVQDIQGHTLNLNLTPY